MPMIWLSFLPLMEIFMVGRNENEKIERFPELQEIRLFDFELLYLTIHAFEASAPQKILVKLRDNLLKEE